MRLIFALTVFLTSLAAQAIAATPVGKIMVLEGQAHLTPSGTEFAKLLSEGDVVNMDDTIETFPDSKVLLLLNDNTEIILGEDAAIIVDEFLVNPDKPEENKGRFNMIKGAFLFTSGLISKTEKPDVQIKTGYGTIGIRGTIVWGGPLNNQYGVLVQLGEVDVENEQGKVSLTPGQGAFMEEKGAAPRKNSGWSDELISKAVRMISIDKIDDDYKAKIEEQKKSNVPE